MNYFGALCSLTVWWIFKCDVSLDSFSSQGVSRPKRRPYFKIFLVHFTSSRDILIYTQSSSGFPRPHDNNTEAIILYYNFLPYRLDYDKDKYWIISTNRTKLTLHNKFAVTDRSILSQKITRTWRIFNEITMYCVFTLLFY